MKTNEQYVTNIKTKYGISIKAFRDFFVKDNKVFSIVPIKTFNGKDSYPEIKQFVEDNLLKTETYREILVTCSCLFNEDVASHAGTFLRQELANGKVKVIYYDPYENHMFERGDHRIDYKKIFSRFELVSVYCIKGRKIMNVAEKERINGKMNRIMTGKNENAIEKKK